MMSQIKMALVSVLVLSAAAAAASPNLSEDDPVYEELAVLRARGELPAYLGGVRPLTEDRARQLLGRPIGVERPGWWVAPITRLLATASLDHETARPYSTVLRPREVTGAIALSCEHAHGRPCGEGLGLASELDASGGFGPWISASLRLRARTGTDAHTTGLDLDRVYINADLGPVTAEVGRDVLALGPSSRTQLGWGDHAPPLDHVRVATSRPLNLAGDHGSLVRGSLMYLVGRLRAPQTYPGNLVTIARGQLDIANELELGMMQLLQLTGDGAPSFTPWGFVLEHVRRADKSASSTDSSNRRIGFDVATRIASLRGARFYYQLVFEDLRKQVLDAIRYDADHLTGVEIEALGRVGITLEWLKTGVRSQEHHPRATGFTNAGRLVGSPLGPDAQAVFAGARIEFGWGTVLPWLEVARLASDTYMFDDHGPIIRTSEGVSEVRYRAGTRVRLPIGRGVRAEVEARFEHVAREAFELGAHRDNVGATASVIWQP